jgi:hypothetical protein
VVVIDVFGRIASPLIVHQDPHFVIATQSKTCLRILCSFQTSEGACLNAPGPIAQESSEALGFCIDVYRQAIFVVIRINKVFIGQWGDLPNELNLYGGD